MPSVSPAAELSTAELTKEELDSISDVLGTERKTVDLKKELKITEKAAYKNRRILVQSMIKKVVHLWTFKPLIFTWRFELNWKTKGEDEEKRTTDRLSLGLRQLYPESCSAYLLNRLTYCPVYGLFKQAFFSKGKQNTFYQTIQPEFVAHLCASALSQAILHVNDVIFGDQQTVTCTLRLDQGIFYLHKDQNRTINLAKHLAKQYNERWRVSNQMAVATPPEITPDDPMSSTSHTAAEAVESITQAGGDDTSLSAVRPIVQLFDQLRDLKLHTFVLWVGCGDAKEIKEIASEGLNRGKFRMFGMDINVYDKSKLHVSGNDDYQLEYGCNCAFNLAERVATHWPERWGKEGEILVYTTALCGSGFNHKLIIELKKLQENKEFFKGFEIKSVCGFGNAIKNFAGTMDLLALEPSIHVKTSVGKTGFTMKFVRWDAVSAIGLEETWMNIQAELLKDSRTILEYKYTKQSSDTIRFDDRFCYKNQADGITINTVDQLKKNSWDSFEPEDLASTIKGITRLFCWGWDDNPGKMKSALNEYMREEVKKAYTRLRPVSRYLENSAGYAKDYESEQNEIDAKLRAAIKKQDAARLERKRAIEYAEQQKGRNIRKVPEIDVTALTSALKHISLDPSAAEKERKSFKDELLDLLIPYAETRILAPVWIAIGMHELEGDLDTLKEEYVLGDGSQCSPKLDTIRLSNLRRRHQGKEFRIVSNEQLKELHYTSSFRRLSCKNREDMFHKIAKEFIRSASIEMVFVDYNRMPTSYLEAIVMNGAGVIQLKILALAMKKDAKVYIPWVFRTTESLQRFQKTLGDATCHLFEFAVVSLEEHPLWEADAFLPKEYFNHEDDNEASNKDVPLLRMTRNAYKMY